MSLKLISELNEAVETLSEGEGADRKFYLNGTFLQGAIKNRNGRIYPMNVLDPEVARYVRESVAVGSGWGELSHPQSPTINPERVSHRTISLVKEGNDYVGRAVLVPNPCGAIVKGLIESGGRVGVSSRALGSLRENSQGIMEVQPDLRIATCADVVLDPSAPSAWVNGIMEGVEFVMTDDGRVLQQEVKQEISKLSLRQIEERKLDQMASFFMKLLNS